MLVQLRPGLLPCKPRSPGSDTSLQAQANVIRKQTAMDTACQSRLWRFRQQARQSLLRLPKHQDPRLLPHPIATRKHHPTSCLQLLMICQPQRCMAYVKDTFPQEKYEASFRELFVAMWEQGLDLSKPELMADALSRHFSHDEVKRIMEGANSAEYKKKLSDNTQKALDLGAFGCPWFWVRNDKGEEEPFFGSDR